MKYLKKFENKSETFKVGDIVRILANEFNGEIGYIYRKNTHDFDVMFTDDDTGYWFKPDELELVTQEEKEQYELKRDTKKYNL